MLKVIPKVLSSQNCAVEASAIGENLSGLMLWFGKKGLVKSSWLITGKKPYIRRGCLNPKKKEDYTSREFLRFSVEVRGSLSSPVKTVCDDSPKDKNLLSRK